MAKKLLSMFLALIMAVSLLVGCGKNPDNDEKSGNESGEKQNQDTEPENTVDPAQVAFDATDVDLGEEEFKIVCVDSVGNSTNELLRDEESSEALEQAVFTRNLLLAEKCNLTYLVSPVSDVGAVVRASNKSGDQDCKVAFPNMMGAATLASANQLVNFESVEEINLDANWWDQGTRELVIADGVFFMNSSINYFSYDVTYMMLFSKKLAEDLGIESLYGLVNNHEWTLDKFAELLKDVAKNDGDDDKTNDRYGFITTSMYGNTFFYGSDLKYVKCAMGEEPSLMLDNTKLEKVDKLLDKLFEIYYNDNATYECSTGQERTGMNMFAQNQALFYGEVASYIVNLRIMSDDFGVIPVPLYDTNQENYLTWTNAIGSTMVIPKNLSDETLENVGKVAEAMAELSHVTTRRAYYEIVLKSKGARDGESGPMLDIVFAHRVYDVASYYELGLNSIFQNCVSNNSKTFASGYEKAAKNFDKKVRSITRNIK